MKRFSLKQLLPLLLLLLCLSGCSLLKASSAKQFVFVPQPELLAEHRDRAPFFGYWVSDPNEYFNVRRKLARFYIAPVNTQFAEQQLAEVYRDKKKRKQRIEEARELARYFREKLKMSLAMRSGGRFQSVEEKTPGALELQLAIVQITPTNPTINLAGTIAGFFVPGGGLIKYAGEGSIAIEGYVESSAVQTTYEQFADREGQKAAPFTLKDYQRYAHIRIAIDDWSEHIATLLTTAPEYKVEDSLPVSLNPF